MPLPRDARLSRKILAPRLFALLVLASIALPAKADVNVKKILLILHTNQPQYHQQKPTPE